MTASRPAGVGCDLVAWAALTARDDEIPALRRSPGTLGDIAFPTGLLKHSDEQTVVGLAAVLRAVSDWGLDPRGFAGWGVVAAPRFLGRAAFDAAFPQFLAEGAWGVSPLLISSHSLHSVSGMVSQALKAHGPNLGVGGTPGDDEQALLTAATWVAEGSAPGVWVVLTGRSPGWDGVRGEQLAGVCEGLALALAAPRPGWAGIRLVIAPGDIRTESANVRADTGHQRPGPHLSRADHATGGWVHRPKETTHAG